MKIRLFLLLLIFISLFLELTIISFPLIFLLTYIIFSIDSNPSYLIPAGILSISADAILNHPLGATLIGVCMTILAVAFYARFLGSKDTLVYILFGVMGIFIYAIILGYSITSLFNWFILVLILWIIYRLIPKKYLSL